MEKSEKEVVSDIFTSLIALSKLCSQVALILIFALGLCGWAFYKLTTWGNLLAVGVVNIFLIYHFWTLLKTHKMLTSRKKQFE